MRFNKENIKVGYYCKLISYDNARENGSAFNEKKDTFFKKYKDVIYHIHEIDGSTIRVHTSDDECRKEMNEIFNGGQFSFFRIIEIYEQYPIDDYLII